MKNRSTALTEYHFIVIEPNLGSRCKKERDAAFERLVGRYRDKEIARLRWQFPAESDQVLTRVVNDAFFIKYWTKGKGRKQKDQSWKARWHLAYFRQVTKGMAFNAARQRNMAKNRFFRGENEGDIVTSQEEGLVSYAASATPVDLAAGENDLQNIVSEVTKNLPKQQYKVAVVMQNCDGIRIGPAAIVKEYKKKYREDLSITAAKGALAAIRMKLKKARLLWEKKDGGQTEK